MEKRFVSFVILSMLILIGFQVLDSKLNPRPPEQLAQNADDVLNGDASDNTLDGNDGPGGGTARGNGVNSEATGDDATQTRTKNLVGASAESNDASDSSTDATTDEPPSSAASGTSSTDESVAFQAEASRVSIGSLDPNRPERLLVWLNSYGAAVECIALNSERYSDLERHFGYLGFLGLEVAENGCRIGVVGDGTPAALAVSTLGGGTSGLVPGDVIVSADDQATRSKEDFQQWLETTRPGQTVSLTVNRGGRELIYQATLRKQPLEVIRPESSQSATIPSGHPLSYRLSLQQLGDQQVEFDQEELPGIPSLKNRHWQLQQDEQAPSTVEFHYVLSASELEPFGMTGPLRIIKRYRMAAPADGGEDSADSTAFHLDYEIEFRNEASGGEPMTLAYQQDGPTGLPLEGWWYTYKTHPTKMGGAGVRDVVTKAFEGKYKMFTNPKLVERLAESPQSPSISMYEGETPRVRFAGVDAQYFVSAIVADLGDGKRTEEDYLFQEALAVPIAPKDADKPSRTDVTFRLVSPPKTIAAGESYRQSFTIFAGPKKADVLANYGLDECITYGWFPLVAKPLTWILHGFHAIFRNYGIAIIMLTVLVRSCMFPIGRQQALNAQKMQDLAPEMRQIADKYKNDMEKRASAQRELFQKHNYNPLAGCLPMLFQFPIFIGLYRALSVDIELRQAPLIPGLRWCSNLAGPDQLMNWQSFMPEMLASRTGWLGPYLNVLPLITVALMMLHQKLFTPPPTDEQQEMQHKMMKYMMLFFGLMFFRVPAGLCLYFITSNLWSVAERKLLPKRTPPSATTAVTATTPVKAKASAGSGGGKGGGGGSRRGKGKRR